MYLQPGRDYLGGLRHLTFSDPTHLSDADLALYLAEHDRRGRPVRWLFDSFVVSARPASGNCMHADVNLGTSMAGEGDFFAWPSPQPTNAADWREVIAANFAPGGPLDRLNSAVARLAAVLGPPPRPLNAVLYHPYPSPAQPKFGPLDAIHSAGASAREDARSLNFSVLGQSLDRASRQRLDAARLFIDESLRHWKEAAAARRWLHLNLLGFYWPHETIYRGWDVDDHWLLKELKFHANDCGLRLLWIPFWCSWNVALLAEHRRWFDAAWLQPNYMFYEAVTGVGEAAEAAKAREAGIEMEFYITQGAGVFRESVRAERLERFRGYLNGGVDYGYMTEASCAWYLGDNALAHLYNTGDAADFALYEDICAFIAGTYRKH